MISPYFLIGLAGLFVGVVASRIVSERAFRLLTSEQKLALVEAFAQLRMYGSIPLMLVLGLMIAVMFLPHAYIVPGFFGTCVLFLAVMTWQQLYVRRKLQAMPLAEEYRRMLSRAQWLSRLGFLGFFAGMAATLLR